MDEPLLEVSTDKVDTEIPSPVAGTLLEIKAAEDETVEVGALLAVIGAVRRDRGTGRGAGGGEHAPRAPQEPAAEPEPEPSQPTAGSPSRPPSSRHPLPPSRLRPQPLPRAPAAPAPPSRSPRWVSP